MHDSRHKACLATTQRSRGLRSSRARQRQTVWWCGIERRKFLALPPSSSPCLQQPPDSRVKATSSFGSARLRHQCPETCDLWREHPQCNAPADSCAVLRRVAFLQQRLRQAGDAVVVHCRRRSHPSRPVERERPSLAELHEHTGMRDTHDPLAHPRQRHEVGVAQHLQLSGCNSCSASTRP